MMMSTMMAAAVMMTELLQLLVYCSVVKWMRFAEIVKLIISCKCCSTRRSSLPDGRRLSNSLRKVIRWPTARMRPRSSRRSPFWVCNIQRQPSSQIPATYDSSRITTLHLVSSTEQKLNDRCVRVIGLEQVHWNSIDMALWGPKSCTC